VQEGYEILGSQVRVQLYGTRGVKGQRVIDHLVKTPTGRIMAVEVKSGGATRAESQVVKDKILRKQGGRIIGGNIPPEWYGSPILAETIIRH
jgi:hypothetical protein